MRSGCSIDVKIGDAVLCAVIVVGNNTRGYASMGAVVEREHGHSWWHIAVDKGSKYVDRNHKPPRRLCDVRSGCCPALARSSGPDKKTVTIDEASPP